MFWIKTFREINRKLDVLASRQIHIIDQGNRIMAEIDDLEAVLTRIESVDGSIIALVQDIKAKLDAALADGDNSALRGRIAAVASKLGVDADAIAAAVIANTPAAPPAPPPSA